MNTRSHSRSGFTLVELLVSMVIFGFVLAAVGALLSGTLRFSSVVYSSADRTRELNDAAGYLSDNVRRASSVDVGTCTASGLTAPCMGLVVANASGADGDAIDGYLSLVYLLWPRSALDVEFKRGDSWADLNTWVLVEYRQEIACVGCQAPPAIASLNTVDHDGPFLLLDLVDASFFEVGPAVFALDGDTVEIALRVRSLSRSGETAVPSAGAYLLRTNPRNVVD